MIMLKMLIVLVVVCVLQVHTFPRHNFILDGDDYDLSLGETDRESVLLRKLGATLTNENDNAPESRRVERTAFLQVKTARQKDKRYASYLTLCHFKICNMGRKRTTRYFHLINSLDNAT